MPRAPRRYPTRPTETEYQRRLRLSAGLPREVQRGHGPVTTKTARQIEAGKLKVKTHSPGVAKYYEKYRGGYTLPGSVRVAPIHFGSKSVAEEYARVHYGSATGSYIEYTKLPTGEWRVRIFPHS